VGYFVADSTLARLCERDLARMVRRMMKSGMTSEDIKEYFVTAIPKVLVRASKKQPKAGYKQS
jgi:hypothetical protein